MKKLKIILINLLSLPFLAGFMGVLFFPAAGTVKWLNGWLVIISLIIYIIFYTAYFLVTDPSTLERRSKLSTEKGDSVNLILIGVLFLAILVLPAFDFRYGWSQVPFSLSLISLFFLAGSYAILFIVSKQNTYASKGLRIHEGQKIISTGLYSVVRHPLYLGGIIMGISLPLVLGSLIGVIPGLVLPLIYALRIKKEELMLERELDGYEEYRKKVKYRLIPGLW